MRIVVFLRLMTRIYLPYVLKVLASINVVGEYF
jgi:hypothetical protein